MVRMYASLVVLFAITTYASPVKRSVEQVKKLVTNLNSQVIALDKAITDFPKTGGSILNALAIHNEANKLVSDTKTTTTEVQNTKDVSDADGQTIFDLVLPVESVMHHALAEIVAKKPAFEGLPIGGISGVAKQDLNNMNGAVTDLGNALIAGAPPILVADATALRDRLKADFAAAIAAYSRTSPANMVASPY